MSEDSTNTLPALPGAKAEVSQLMILKGEAVDIKIAEIEKNLRKEKETLQKKRRNISESQRCVDQERQELEDKLLRPVLKAEVMRLFKGLKKLFKYCASVDKITLDEFLNGYKLDERRLDIRRRYEGEGDSKELAGWWVCTNLNHAFGEDNFRDEAAYPVDFDGSNDEHQKISNLLDQSKTLNEEYNALDKLLDEVNKHLSDFSSLERQVRAKISQKMFDDLGINLDIDLSDIGFSKGGNLLALEGPATDKE